MPEPETQTRTTKRIAVIGEGLNLLNLLFPLLPLLGLAWLWSRHRTDDSALLRNHLRQALRAAMISSAVFLAANLLILYLGGYRGIQALIVFEVYFILVVPLFLIPGLLGLLRAMDGRPYRYPLIGDRDAG